MKSPRWVVAAATEKLHEWFAKVVSTPQTKRFLNQFGGDPLVGTLHQGQARLLRDIGLWKDYARIAKIVPQ